MLDFLVVNQFSFFCTPLGNIILKLVPVSLFARFRLMPTTLLGGEFGGHLSNGRHLGFLSGQSIWFLLYNLWNHPAKCDACIMICAMFLYSLYYFGRWVWRPSLKWPPSWIFEWPIDSVSFVHPWESSCQIWCLYHHLHDFSLIRSTTCLDSCSW